MRFNNRSRGLLLVKFRLAKGRLHGRIFSTVEPAKTPLAEMQTGFFTLEVCHNFPRKMNEKLFRSTIPRAAAGSSHTGRSSI